MIRTFADKSTELLARGQRVQRFVAFERVARRKLQQLEIAGDLQDLRIPPGNHLEKLSGDREGFWSIRINDQYRIYFRWTAAGPTDVQITDYH